PSALERACGGRARSGPPDLRLAGSCGYDLRPSNARAAAEHGRGLRICAWLAHAATTFGPRTRVRRPSTVGASGSAPGWLMRLRPSALERACGGRARSGPPDLRLAGSCGYDLRPSNARAAAEHGRGLRICAWLAHAAT